MKEKIAQASLLTSLLLVAVSYLPWVYLQPMYYILRYAVMGLLGISSVLVFSFRQTFTGHFMKIFLIAIILIAVEFLIFKLMSLHFRLEDLTQLVVAFLCIMVGMNMKRDLCFWRDASYYYTICLVVMGIINCLYYAKGLYVPEYYMFNEGKNQVGALIATGAVALFFFGMKMREQRVHFWVVFFLAVEVLLLIRARADFFALLACVLLIVIKDGNWKWKWNPKVFFTILAVILGSYILLKGFLGNELHTFFSGGKNMGYDAADAMSTNRLHRDADGMKEFVGNPFDGELSEDSGIRQIHNYAILRLVRYGVWAFPFLLFYAFFGIRMIIGIFKPWHSDVRQVGFIVCGLPCIVSFFEPSFPFGPGEVQLLVFLLLGFSLASGDGMPEQNEKLWLDEIRDFRNRKKKTS